MRQCLAVVTVLALVVGPSGCDKSANKSSAKSADTPTGQPSGPVAGKTGGSASEVSDATEEAATPGTPIPGPTGRIEGTVTFVGDELLTSNVVSNGTDPQFCGAEVSKEDVVISPESRGIRNVFLWLDEVMLPEGYQPPTSHLVVDNVQCQFQPHAAAITVGSTVQAKNSDAIYHTTHFYGDLNENPPLPDKGSRSRSYRVRRPGMMNVKCDKHGWMQAYVLVSRHPFHAVTDADGRFAIADVPVGSYKVRVWHEHFGVSELAVTVADSETTTLQAKYPATDN